MFENLVAVRRDKKIYREGNKLVKLFDENYSKSNVLNEAINQARVEETGLNIPKIREVTVIDGKWAISMDYIEGETLEKLMEEHPERRAEYLKLFIGVQMEIHSKRNLLLTKFVDKMTMKILGSDLDASTRYDLSMRMAAMPRHNHVCHGDFNPSNVVVTPDGTPFILDWSHASQGNASADVAKTYLIFKTGGEDDLAEEYLSEFCKTSDISVEYVQEWIPLVAAAQLIKADGKRKEMLMPFINGEANF